MHFSIIIKNVFQSFICYLMMLYKLQFLQHWMILDVEAHMNMMKGYYPSIWLFLKALLLACSTHHRFTRISLAIVFKVPDGPLKLQCPCFTSPFQVVPYFRHFPALKTKRKGGEIKDTMTWTRDMHEWY